MFGSGRNRRQEQRVLHRVAIALSKGGAMMNARRIDLTRPASWEFSGFSQNGEDGIIDVLRRQLLRSNRYCIEIGAAEGLENNTAWLFVAEQYAGLMIEGDPEQAKRCRRLTAFSIGAECHQMFVSRDSIPALKDLAWHHDPDVFSLDIDGMDYYVAEALLDGGFRPRIFVVEYNSVYGPERSLTVGYEPDFVLSRAHPTQLFYGVSITGWRRFFEPRGYRFVTVNRHGVNAFFVDEAQFDAAFLVGVRGLPFAENLYQYRKFHRSSEEQFALIADKPFVSI